LLDFSNGELRDRSEDVVQLPSNRIKTGNDWCHHLFFNEKTAWNMPILTCTNIIPLSESKGYFYTWTQNKLQLAKINSKNLSQWIKRFYPVTIDQKNVFLGKENYGERKVSGFSFWDSIYLYLVEPPLSEAELSVVGSEISNSFDGRYSFDLFRYHDDEDWQELGNGFVEIMNGELIIDKDNSDLKTGSKDLYDTFSGQINKKGKVSASTELDILGGGVDRSEIYHLNGHIDGKIWGDSPREGFFRIYMLLVKK
jgi:hypothetical protein